MRKVALYVLPLVMWVGMHAATSPAHAQQAPPAWITAGGVGTAEVLPATVTFWLRASAPDTPGITQAAEKLADLEQRVRTQLDEKALSPSEIEVTGTAVPGYDPADVRRSVRLRFPMGPFVNPEKGAASFATLAENMKAVAEAVGAEALPPQLDAPDREQLVAEAVERAVENAYPAAEAAAAVMGAQLTVVQGVEINEIRWNTTPDHVADEPNLRRVACTAEVRVSYGFSLRR